jgi:endonuclease/exonuclease/phosphatase family metal-dependent hydrolase
MLLLLRAFVLASLLLSSGLARNLAAQEMKLMTWNICGVHCYTGNIFGLRWFDQVIRTPKVSPDVIALQEVTLDEALRFAETQGYKNRADILAHLQFVRAKDYKITSLDHWYLTNYGLRASDFGGDSSPLGGYPMDFGNAIITSRRFPIYDRGRLTLPTDPARASSELNRVALVDIQLQSGTVRFCSMHTANAVTQAPYARAQATQMVNMANFVFGKSYRYVLLGDFNMQRPSNPNDMNHAYNILRGRFNDTWYEWQRKHPGMGDWLGTTTVLLDAPKRYDYIFLDNRRNTDILEAKALNPSYIQADGYPWSVIGGLYEMWSDHYPVFARVNFK